MRKSRMDNPEKLVT